MKKFILFYLFVNYNKCGDTMKEIMIITGASSGMGKEFARQIEKKYQVDELWVIARRKERLESLKEILETKVKVLALDLTQKNHLKYFKRLYLKKTKSESSC